MKREIIAIFSISILLLVVASAFAGPVSDKDITFTLTVPNISELQQGDWQLSIVSIGEFEKNNWSFEKYNISNQYTTHKRNCGSANSFYEHTYKMSAEESKHKGCIINGTYQTEFCFETASDNVLCKQLAAYKINDNKQLTFDSFYNSYVWDINRADQYHHFAAKSCTITNNTCTFVISKNSEPYNPYLFVLEQLNSTNVYFSNKIRIESTKIFADENTFNCVPDGCDVNVDKNITATTFAIMEPHTLDIVINEKDIAQDNRSKSVVPEKEIKSTFSKFISWFKSLFK